MQTVTHLYDTRSDCMIAQADMQAVGIPSADISLLSAEAGSDKETARMATGVEFGAVVGGGAGLLAGVGMFAIPGLGPVVAIGWLASALAGLVAGSAAGGVIGALTNAGLNRDIAHIYAEGIRRGGSLLTVRVEEDRVLEAQQIMARHRPVNALVRANELRQSGWKEFVEKATPREPHHI